MPNPFNRDGKLSRSGLRQMGRLAESPRRHIGSGNFYTAPDGGVVLEVSSAAAATDLALVRAAASTHSQVFLSGGSIKAYQANIVTEDSATGLWTIGNSVWLQQANDNVWGNPDTVPVVVGEIYQCRFFENDQSGVPIWSVAQEFPPAGSVLVDGFVDGGGFGNQNLTTSWATISDGLSPVQLSLPSAGTYLIWGVASCSVSTTDNVTGAFIWARLYDATNSAEVGDPQLVCANESPDGVTRVADGGSATVQHIYTVTGPATIELQAVVTGTATTAIAYTANQAPGTAPSACYAWYRKIG